MELFINDKSRILPKRLFGGRGPFEKFLPPVRQDVRMYASFEDELHLSRIEDIVRRRRHLHLDEGVSLRSWIVLIRGRKRKAT